MVIFPREKQRAEQTHKIISIFGKSGIFHFLSVFNKITHLFSVQEVHITAQAMFGRLFKSFVIFWEPFWIQRNTPQSVSHWWLSWLSIWMVPTCWTSLCVWAQYQLQVCISPSRIRLGYVSHQPKYCIRQQAPVQCMYLTKQNTAPSTTHRWYVSHKHYQPHPQRL